MERRDQGPRPSSVLRAARTTRHPPLAEGSGALTAYEQEHQMDLIVCWRCNHDQVDHGVLYYACLCGCPGFVHEDDPERDEMMTHQWIRLLGKPPADYANQT